VSDRANKKRTVLYIEVLLGLFLAGLAAAYLLPGSASGRSGALGGVGLAASSALVALYLKRWAVEKSLKASLAIVGIVFLLRLLLVSVGLMLVLWFKAGVVAFTAGFFGIYFVLQWLEISYLLGGRSRGPRQARGERLHRGVG